MKRTLKEWRVNRNLTQLQLAKKIGVPQSTYNAWERNNNQIKIGNVMKICEALEIQPQDILFFNHDSYFKDDLQEAR